jgi:hypothetical protein
MADNVLINATTEPGGATIATDDVGGIQHELVKLEFGTDGVATMVSAADPLPVTDKTTASTGTTTSVSDSNVNQTLLAANSSRLGATIYNDSTEILYLKLGATASLTSFTARLVPNAYYEVPFRFIGIIDGIWAANGSGAARITELQT